MKCAPKLEDERKQISTLNTGLADVKDDDNNVFSCALANSFCIFKYDELTLTGHHFLYCLSIQEHSVLKDKRPAQIARLDMSVLILLIPVARRPVSMDIMPLETRTSVQCVELGITVLLECE